MFGRMMNETLGKVHFWLSFVGAYAIFHAIPLPGHGRNAPLLPGVLPHYVQRLIPLHQFITVAALVTGAAQLIFLYNLIHSRFSGARQLLRQPVASAFPGMEHANDAARHNNFGDNEVYDDGDEYGVESSAGDYVMQASPEQVKTIHDLSMQRFCDWSL